MRLINEAGLKLIKEFEGLRLHAYPDPGTGNLPYTIGYGHTAGVRLTDTVTEAQAEQFLLSDIRSTQTAVDNFTKSIELTDDQFSALVSFAYNVGSWRSSRVFVLLLANKPDEAADAILLYDHAAGRVLLGLTRRRNAERILFLQS